MKKEYIGLFEDKDKRVNQYVFNQELLDSLILGLKHSRKLHKRFTVAVSNDLAGEVEALFVKYFEGKELRNSMMHLNTRVINPKKRKWMKTIDKDLSSKAFHLESLVDTDVDGTDELDEDQKIEYDLKKTKKRAIEWYENDEARLIDYPLFKLKSRTVQRNSVLEDIACFMGKYFWEDLDSEKRSKLRGCLRMMPLLSTVLLARKLMKKWMKTTVTLFIAKRSKRQKTCPIITMLVLKILET